MEQEDRAGTIVDCLEAWMRQAVGADTTILGSILTDDDWTAIVKLHAIIETALNHSLTREFDNEAISAIIAKLNTSDPRTGKIAFARPQECCSRGLATSCKSFPSCETSAYTTSEISDLALKNTWRKCPKQNAPVGLKACLTICRHSR